VQVLHLMHRFVDLVEVTLLLAITVARLAQGEAGLFREGTSRGNITIVTLRHFLALIIIRCGVLITPKVCVALRFLIAFRPGFL